MRLDGTQFRVLLAVGAVLLPATALSQLKGKDLDQYLAGVTERGRAIYEYDQCAWHGTDAIMALHPDMNGGAHYVCAKTSTGWRLVFPRWNAAHDHLLVAYEATGSATDYTAQKLDPPQDAGDALTADERALELAFGDFGHPTRPYNTAILPAPDGNLYVYFYPGQTDAAIWPIGGDVRYTISSDGQRVLEKRQLHKSILDMKFPPDVKPASGFHTHVLSDTVEDTDVFYVLNRQPLIPEYIGPLGGWFFVVNADGSISSMEPCKKPNPLPCPNPKKK